MTSRTPSAAVKPPLVAEELAPELEEPYRRLLRVLRASREMFALVPVESLLPRQDNDRLLERLLQDLERDGLELRFADVFYQDWDPLPAIERAWEGLEGPAVVVLRGLERTPPAPLGMAKTPRPLAFARLNQVREHVEKQFPAPLVVWCEPESFGALQRYAPDFFDHFAGLIRFRGHSEAADEVREPEAVYGRDRRSGSLPAKPGGSRSALRFYEAQLERSAEGSRERVRALLGLAGSLLRLTGSEAPAAAARILEAVHQALSSLSAENEPQEWARAKYLQGGGYKAAGRLEDARTSFERALEVRRRLAGDNPAIFEKDVASTLVYLGNVLGALGDHDARRSADEEALGIYRRLAARHPEAFEPHVAGALNNLGRVLSDLGDQDVACTSFEEALEIYRRLAAQNPEAFEPFMAGTLNNLGLVLSDLGDHDTARTTYEEALEIYRRLAAQHPRAFEPALAMTLNNLGTLLGDLGDHEIARTNFQEALKIFAPLEVEWPAAFSDHLFGALRNYIAVAPEDDEDPWRQRWNQLQEQSKPDQPEAEPTKRKASHPT